MEGEELTLRIVTMGCATIMVICAASVAGVASRGEGRWWATLGAFVVALATLYVAYRLFRTGYYAGWNN